MSADVESMAYRKESRSDVPWHGLGCEISHDASPEEMLEKAQLNWTVSKRPLYTIRQERELMEVDDYFALVRDSDSKILGPAGKDYIPIQNLDAFKFFKKFTDSGSMRMETAGSLQSGKQVWVMAKINKSFVLPGNDVIESYLLLSSPHVWGKSLVIKFTTIRVVCSNTFAMAMSESGRTFRMPHIRAFGPTVAKEAEETLGIADILLDAFERRSRLLAEKHVTAQVVVNYIADLFQPELVSEVYGKKYFEANAMKQAELLVSPKLVIDPSRFKRSAFDILNCVNQQPGADLASSAGTMWGAFNAVTYHSDFVAGISRDNALYSSWFGPKAVTKAKALKRAVEIASA